MVLRACAACLPWPSRCCGATESSPGLPATLKNVAITATNGTLPDVMMRVVGSYCGTTPSRQDGGRKAVSRCLVFCNTRAEVMKLAAAANSLPNVDAAGLQGDLSQAAREGVLAKFRAGRVNCLFATDVAARGLDIPNVETVVHYHPARQLNAFTHRSGRTARAGAEGTNVVLYVPTDKADVEMMQTLERALDFRFDVVAVPQPKPQKDDAQLVSDAKRKVRVALDVVNTTTGEDAALLQQQTDDILRYLAKIAPDGGAALGILAAALLDRGELPTQFSLLTGKVGFVTASVEVPTAGAGRLTPRALSALLGDILHGCGLDAGMLDAMRPTGQGALFDVPSMLWPRVQAAFEQDTTGAVLSEVTTLPDSVRMFQRARRNQGGNHRGGNNGRRRSFGGHNRNRGGGGGGGGGYGNSRNRGGGGGGRGGGGGGFRRNNNGGGRGGGGGGGYNDWGDSGGHRNQRRGGGGGSFGGRRNSRGGDQFGSGDVFDDWDSPPRRQRSNNRGSSRGGSRNNSWGSGGQSSKKAYNFADFDDDAW